MFTGDWKTRFDHAIRNGQAAQVRADLEQVSNFKIEREDLADLAAIARRVGLPALTIRLLEPVVHPKFPLKQEATPLELATYASGLARFGALEVAEDILKKLKPHGLREVSLYLSYI